MICQLLLVLHSIRLVPSLWRACNCWHHLVYTLVAVPVVCDFQGHRIWVVSLDNYFAWTSSVWRVALICFDVMSWIGLTFMTHERCKFSNLKRIDWRNLAELSISERLGDLSEEFGLGALEGQVWHVSLLMHFLHFIILQNLAIQNSGFLESKIGVSFAACRVLMDVGCLVLIAQIKWRKWPMHWSLDPRMLSGVYACVSFFFVFLRFWCVILCMDLFN